MAELGYGKDYKYPHEAPEAIVDQQYMPSKLKGRKYYFPTDRGFEGEIKKRMKYWQRIKENLRKIKEKNKRKPKIKINKIKIYNNMLIQLLILIYFLKILKKLKS